MPRANMNNDTRVSSPSRFILPLPVLRVLKVILVTAVLCPASAAFVRHTPLSIRPALSILHVNNEATSILLGGVDENDDNNNQEDTSKNISSPRLSRPERKAQERANKLNKTAPRRKHNFKERSQILQDDADAGGSGRYDLHSTAVATLNQDSTADDVMRAIKRAQNLHDVHDIRAIERFLLEQTDASFAYGYKGSLLARLAVAALHVNNHELARKAITVRRVEYPATMMPMESAAIIRGLLRVHNVTDALTILDDELALPLSTGLVLLSEPSNKEIIKHRALSLASIASRHFFENEPSMAVLACQQLAELGPIVRQAELEADDINMPWARILRGAAQCESGRRDGRVKLCDGVEVDIPRNVAYSVLHAMTTFPSENTDRVYELLSNALVRRVLFITGAIDMNGCPPADRGEAVFIGRSNVGKSSLVNMVTARKSLAYTSKRPGKTQQFNFFAVNDKPGKEKEVRYGDDVPGEKDPDSFYIVDLPGFGYAKVPEAQRQQWAAFTQEYISKRPTLRVVFHLVDGRHGPTDEDASIMRQVSQNLPSYAKYVVLLTKADKNVKSASTKNSGKVSTVVMNRLRETMQESGIRNTPVILTSAETKLGRDDIWRYLRLAAEA